MIHKHHIVPRYKCKELGIDPDFNDNFVEVTREQHALIHWGYWCNDLSPLLEVCSPPQYVLDMIPLGDKRDIPSAIILAEGEIDGIDQSGENNPRWGVKETEETKEKKRQAMLKLYQIPIEEGGRKGWKPTEEMNRRNSETKKQMYAEGKLVPWNKDKKGVYSEETRKKMGDAKRGNKHTEEAKRKMSEDRRGKGNANYSHGLSSIDTPIEERRKHHAMKEQERRNKDREGYNQYMREYRSKLTREQKDIDNRKRREYRLRKKLEKQGKGTLESFV